MGLWRKPKRLPRKRVYRLLKALSLVLLTVQTLSMQIHGFQWGETPLEVIKEKFMPYQVNEALMEATGASYVMHCQPAHRDLEITGSLIDSDKSLLMQQAENRMHGQNAILTQLLSA